MIGGLWKSKAAPFRAHRKQKEGQGRRGRRGSPPPPNFFTPGVTVNFDYQLHWLTKYLGHEWGIPSSVSVRTFPKSVGGAIPQAGDSDWTQEANTSPKKTSVGPFSTYWCGQMWAVTLCSRHHRLASPPPSWWAAPSNRAHINSSSPKLLRLGVCHSRGERKTAGVMSEGSTVSYQHHRVGWGTNLEHVGLWEIVAIQTIGIPEEALQGPGPSRWILTSQREIKGWNLLLN